MRSTTPKVSPMKLRKRAGVLVQTPYDEFLNSQIKGMVPRGDRWWNDHRKGWWVAEEYRDIAIHLVLQCFQYVVVVDDEGEAITHDSTGAKLVQERLL